MRRRLLVLLLILWLPLANASAAVMGMPGLDCTSAPLSQTSASADCVPHPDLQAESARDAVGDGSAHATHCPDHSSSDGSSGHAGCGHCDFCLGALGTPPSATSSDRACAPGERPAALAPEFKSAFLETPRRPPSR
jgi:hypothetical protein